MTTRNTEAPQEMINWLVKEYGWTKAEAVDLANPVCEWISKNPIAPTIDQVRECLKSGEDADGRIPFPGYAVRAFMEWQSKMFLAVEGPSENAKRLGNKMCGVTFTPQDADYLINQVILASAPGYVPPFLDPRGLRKK